MADGNNSNFIVNLSIIIMAAAVAVACVCVAILASNSIEDMKSNDAAKIECKDVPADGDAGGGPSGSGSASKTVDASKSGKSGKSSKAEKASKQTASEKEDAGHGSTGASSKSKSKSTSTLKSKSESKPKQKSASRPASKSTQRTASDDGGMQSAGSENADASNMAYTRDPSTFAYDGVWYDDRYRYTYYSSNALYHYMTDQWTPDRYGVYRDSEGYAVVASSDLPFGSVVNGTPFGNCKVYDSGCASGTLDVYVNF